jgi:predicted RNA binding protein YcfA (HicA-like mRNA interferase family)
LSGLPQVNGARVVRALERAGFVVLRQAGSHAQMRHSTDLSRRVTVPVHKGVDLKPGTLRAILRGAGLTAEQLRDLV